MTRTIFINVFGYIPFLFKCTYAIADESGCFVAGYKYDDFGETEKIGDSTFYNEICYTGAVYDELTGLHYLNARYYNPDEAVFLSQDSYRGDKTNYGTWNLYGYCAGNPIKYVDPSGYWAETALDAYSWSDSYVTYCKDPSLENFGWYLADSAALLLPIPAVGRGARIVDDAVGVAKTANNMDNATDIAKAGKKVKSSTKTVKKYKSVKSKKKLKASSKSKTPKAKKTTKNKKSAKKKGKKSNSTPDYVKNKRVPQDKETILIGKEFKKTGKKVKGAQVYKKGDKYYYRDTFHTGESAHLEVFDKRGRHLGEANPITGKIIEGTADSTKRINVK